MTKLSIENIRAGLITSAPVLTPQGRRLLEAGIELSENHIKQLKAWGIREVLIIDGDNSDTKEEADQESLMLLRNTVERAFPDSEGSALMEAILNNTLLLMRKESEK